MLQNFNNRPKINDNIILVIIFILFFAATVIALVIY